ncbi:Spo7-like protein, partial [Rhizoctonia solani]
MPARSTPPPYNRSGFQPPNNATTFKDLLHFEERLKINAAMLKKRKRKYQVMSPVNLIVPHFDNRARIPLIAWWLDQPESTVPHITTPLNPHPYIIPGLWLVSVTTLVLFFASGLYSEKISYANRYVPQANRALRNFNLHLNVRTQPISPPAPLKYLFPRPTTATSPTTAQQLRKGVIKKAQLNPIPPTNNPRGELIFSNRVDRSFREAYERYRSVWERKREEHLAANRRSWFGWLWFISNKPIPVGPPGKDRGRTTPTPGSSRTPSRRSSPAGGVRKNRTRTPELPSSPLAQTESGGRTSRPSLTTVPEVGVPDVVFPTLGRPPSFSGEEGDESIELVRNRTESFSFLLQRHDSLNSP